MSAKIDFLVYDMNTYVFVDSTSTPLANDDECRTASSLNGIHETIYRVQTTHSLDTVEKFLPYVNHCVHSTAHAHTMPEQRGNEKKNDLTRLGICCYRMFSQQSIHRFHYAVAHANYTENVFASSFFLFATSRLWRGYFPISDKFEWKNFLSWAVCRCCVCSARYIR